MKRDKLPRLSLAELEALLTKRLLTRLQRLQECEESADFSDRDADPEDDDIKFKQTEVWQEAHRQLKQILAHREHVPTSVERREQGKERVHQAKHPEGKASRPNRSSRKFHER